MDNQKQSFLSTTGEFISGMCECAQGIMLGLLGIALCLVLLAIPVIGILNLFGIINL